MEYRMCAVIFMAARGMGNVSREPYTRPHAILTLFRTVNVHEGWVGSNPLRYVTCQSLRGVKAWWEREGQSKCVRVDGGVQFGPWKIVVHATGLRPCAMWSRRRMNVSHIPFTISFSACQVADCSARVRGQTFLRVRP